MALFLDSASPFDASIAAGLGFVRGVTTNPALLRKVSGNPQEIIAKLADCGLSQVFYQLCAETPHERLAEARAMLTVRNNIVALKIPCTSENLALATKLAHDGATVGITAVFSPAQALVACEAGVSFILPYVNRATTLLGDGLHLVNDIRRVVDETGSGTEIIAASIKSINEAVDTLFAGAHHLTLPLALIQEMGENKFSQQAILDFNL